MLTKKLKKKEGYKISEENRTQSSFNSKYNKVLSEFFNIVYLNYHSYLKKRSFS